MDYMHWFRWVLRIIGAVIVAGSLLQIALVFVAGDGWASLLFNVPGALIIGGSIMLGAVNFRAGGGWSGWRRDRDRARRDRLSRLKSELEDLDRATR